MPTATTTAEAAIVTIVKARALLEKDGWVQGKFQNSKGAHCLLDALRTANGPGETEATRIVRHCIGYDIPQWNDKVNRTFKEVNTLLLAAEHIARELAE